MNIDERKKRSCNY